MPLPLILDDKEWISKQVLLEASLYGKQSQKNEDWTNILIGMANSYGSSQQETQNVSQRKAALPEKMF